jgi:hypothetical protein
MKTTDSFDDFNQDDNLRFPEFYIIAALPVIEFDPILILGFISFKKSDL